MRAKLVNEGIKHLSPRTDEEIFDTYPKVWQEFIIKIKERFSKARYIHGLFDFGHIRVKIRKKSYLIAFQRDTYIQKTNELLYNKIVIYHLVKTEIGAIKVQRWHILKAVDDFQEFKDFMKL